MAVGKDVAVSGGHLKKPELLETRVTRSGATFVKLEKSAQWLARAVTGQSLGEFTSHERPLVRPKPTRLWGVRVLMAWGALPPRLWGALGRQR